ncbi:hypothetical protein [Kingella potus]|uniref:hypothetical protein n=1 Tax=Kingella potus TaxID=265175 RepID=UPI001FD3E92A|nr:hypothetical protein [Kingella potus]UOP00462.1 hypothetical protein LVJ84_11380 [Kingella potus]
MLGGRTAVNPPKPCNRPSEKRISEFSDGLFSLFQNTAQAAVKTSQTACEAVPLPTEQQRPLRIPVGCVA